MIVTNVRKCFANHLYLSLFQCLDIQIMLYGPQHKKTKATKITVDMLSQWVSYSVTCYTFTHYSRKSQCTLKICLKYADISPECSVLLKVKIINALWSFSRSPEVNERRKESHLETRPPFCAAVSSASDI